MKRKFGRKKPHREMMLKNLATSVIIYENVRTTIAKAKEVKPFIDKLIDIAKSKSLEGRRVLIRTFKHENAVKKIYEILLDRYKDRVGGYCRIYRLKPRPGDGSPMAQISLIGAEKIKTAESAALVENKPKKAIKSKSTK